ncbi:MAG: DUF4956 domain-containing protein [Lachnospiraceae bacterium]|nr:DUF4956 domain-containing protein [Lachnospiraceae bacterium]
MKNGLMSVKDVIKNSIYEQLGGGTGISAINIIMILLLACLIGVYIFFIYKLMSKAAFYSKDLNITLAGMPIIVAAIMLGMQSSLIVSLGMVGALSIVRFRNAVKNPLDLLYLFWSVSTGILCGVGLSMLVIILCIIMTIMLAVLGWLPNSKADSLLVIRTTNDMSEWQDIKNLIHKHSKYYKEKSRNITKVSAEIIIELRCTNEEELLNGLNKIESIQQLNLLSHDGEYRI